MERNSTLLCTPDLNLVAAAHHPVDRKMACCLCLRAVSVTCVSDAFALHAQEEAGKMEHLMAQRTALQVKKADFERRIKDLGSLPGDAFDKYRDAQPAELHKQLTRCNSQLKKYRCADRTRCATSAAN